MVKDSKTWNCPCGSREISESIEKCPNCGRLRKRGTNFDTIALISIVVIAMSLLVFMIIYVGVTSKKSKFDTVVVKNIGWTYSILIESAEDSSHLRSVNTSGKDRNPYWKEVELRDGEVESYRVENYYIFVETNKGSIIKYDLDYNDWVSVNPNDILEIEINPDGDIRIINISGVVTTE